MTPRLHLLPAAGGALLIALALPWTRHVMEASMWRHMIVQFPLWIGAGALLAGAVPERVRRWLSPWNVNGISGLVIATLTLAVLMVPRALDLALIDPRIEAAKLCALLLTGAALRLSWPRASTVLQFFFLGNMLSMMAIAGMLYTTSPLRLCNAYLLDDQERLGDWLTTAAALLGVAWLAWITVTLIRRENAYFAADPEASQASAQHAPPASTPGSSEAPAKPAAGAHPECRATPPSDLPHARAW